MMRIFVLLAILLITGCSPYKTSVYQNKIEANNFKHGMVYYMPKKDLIASVTVSLDSNNNLQYSDLGVASTDSYPDYGHMFVLNHSRSTFGDTQTDFEISEYGLLSSGKGTYTSKAVNVFDNIGSTLGSTTLSLTGPQDTKQNNCIFPGVYKVKLELPSESDKAPKTPHCGFGFVVEREVDDKYLYAKESNYIGCNSDNSSCKASGIYYRQNLPYSITVSRELPKGGSVDITRFIIGLPNDSPNYFLKASSSFFANTSTDFSLSNGVLTGYDQKTESEFVGLFSIPASIIGKYFDAIGNVFDKKDNILSKEQSYLSQEVLLKLFMDKYKACIAAINDNNSELISELGCNSN